MLLLPGPGWLTIGLGLGILARDFAWAHRLLGSLRDAGTRLVHWLRERKGHGPQTAESGRSSHH